MTLQKTTSLGPPRVDLERNDFETIILQKGREVLFEKALQCPCKSKASNQQSNCKNCGGSSWIFINPKKTRMIVTGVSVTTDYKPWSEESRGMVNVSCSDTEQLTFMDRISLLDANAIHQEVLFFKKSSNDEWFAFSSYPIKKVLYAGLFDTVSTKLLRLRDSELTLNRNVVKLDPVFANENTKDDELSITVRYYHAPVYYVMEMKRETMQSFKFQDGKEVLQNLPLSGIARRSHYVLDPIKVDGTGLLDNSYSEGSCEPIPVVDCCSPLTNSGCPIATVWYTEEGPPGDNLGVDRDMYVDILTNKYYQKLNGAWVERGQFSSEEEDPIFTAWLNTNPLEDFITEETDPEFNSWLSSVAEVANWNLAYSWGDHSQAGYALQTSLNSLQTTLEEHIQDEGNPHHTSLEDARLEDNFFQGDVDFNGNRARNLPTPIFADEAVNKGYVDGLIDSTIKQPDAFTPNPSFTYPSTYFGGPIHAGHSFRITAIGKVGTEDVEPEDLLIAKIDNPGDTESNWQHIDSNKDQATESVKGVAKVASSTDVEDEYTSNNTDFVTPQKLWFGVLRFKDLAWTWAQKQIFTQAPRLNSTTVSTPLAVDNNKDITSLSSIIWGGFVTSLTSKIGLVDSDTINISDSEDTNNSKKVTWATIKYTLVTYLNTLYQVVLTATNLGSLVSGFTSKTTPDDGDSLLLTDSSASNVSKKLSWLNLKAAILSYITLQLVKSKTHIYRFDDFMSGFPNQTQGSAVTYDTAFFRLVKPSSSALNRTAISGHPGIYQFNSTANTSNQPNYIVSQISTPIDSNILYASTEWGVRTDSIGTAAVGDKTFIHRIGFINSVSNVDGQGAYFRYNYAVNGGRWECVTHDGSLETAADSGIAVVAGDWYALKVVVTTADVKFYINGTLVQTVITTLPTSISYSGVLFFVVGGTFVTKAITLDYYSIDILLNNTR